MSTMSWRRCRWQENTVVASGFFSMNLQCLPLMAEGQRSQACTVTSLTVHSARLTRNSRRQKSGRIAFLGMFCSVIIYDGIFLCRAAFRSDRLPANDQLPLTPSRLQNAVRFFLQNVALLHEVWKGGGHQRVSWKRWHEAVIWSDTLTQLSSLSLTLILKTPRHVVRSFVNVLFIIVAEMIHYGSIIPILTKWILKWATRQDKCVISFHVHATLN